MTPLLLGAHTAHAAPEAAESAITHSVEVAVGLVAVAAVIGVLVKFIKVPYTVALVLAGLAIALAGGAPAGVFITQDLVLVLFLPPLLFQAGLHTNLDHLRKVWAPVLIMALPGVVVTAFAVAAAVRPFMADALGEHAATWQVALLVGIVLAPTDPISVMAIFKTTGAPEKLKTVVEGESLFNDGTAVGIFTVLKAAVVGAAAGMEGGGTIADAAGQVSIAEVATRFVFMAGVGTVLGLGLGLIAFFLLKKLNDHTLETAITAALAWGAFVLAESIHASGVIAVVVSALILGNYGKTLSMSEETRTTLTGFWDSVDFIVNSILFLLIGFELSDPAVGGAKALLRSDALLTAGAALLALWAARAVLVYPTVLALKRHWPKGWKHVIFWAGLRGSLSLALIIGMPPGPLRAFLTPVVFLVVLASLLLQALTMPALMRLTGASEDLPVSDFGAGDETPRH